MRRSTLILVGLALTVLVPGGLVAHKEWLLANAEPMLLDFGPVDPRSLIQGDYMTLRYGIATRVEAELPSWPRDGRLVVRPDPDGVAQFVRRDDGTPLAPGERLLRYRRRGGRLRLGAEEFFFQEGQAELFGRARFAELRVTASGSSVLVGLRDDRRQRLGRGRAFEPRGSR